MVAGSLVRRAFRSRHLFGAPPDCEALVPRHAAPGGGEDLAVAGAQPRDAIPHDRLLPLEIHGLAAGPFAAWSVSPQNW